MNTRRSRAVAAPVATVLVFAVGMIVGPGAGHALAVPQFQVTLQASGFLEEFDTELFSVVTNISGENVVDGETFPVSFTGSGTTQLGELSETNQDVFVGTFQPPSNAVCGTNTVTVDDVINGVNVGHSSATLVEQCPQITLSPGSVPQAAEPTTVQVTGTNFNPGISATVALNGVQVTQQDINDTGGFTTPITVSRLACGTYPVTATMVLENIQINLQSPGAPAVLTGDISRGGAGFNLAGPTSTATSATAPLTVTCPSSPSPSPSSSSSPSPSAPPPPGAVTLKATPDIVSIGSVTDVTGTGYTPNAPVTLTWQLAGGVTLPATTTPVNADGSGNITDPLVVLLPAAPGRCNLVATQGTATASAPMVVQDGSMEPSTGDAGGDQLIFRE